ncbi:hypothetical protein GF360_03595 [candidate division WWE3 bacterium]|nr:hypothetical protein [candidate division WWE3 bacterium]
MKKILTSLLIIAAVGTFGYITTSAYFSDTETSEENTFTAGTINIAVDGESPWTTTGTFSIDDMKPGYVFYRDAEITNIGNNPADIWKRLSNMAYADGETSDAEEPGSDNNIGAVIRYDMSIDDEVLFDVDAGYVLDEGPHQLAETTAVEGLYMYLGRLEPGESMTVTQSYHMDPSVGNWAQGDIMTLDVEFYAQQTSGGATAPSPELEALAKDNLDYLDIAASDTADMQLHDAKGWLDYAQGGYGGRDGDETIAMVMGENGVCDETTENATFMMYAGEATANNLVLRHYDGQSDDSFEVFVDGNSVGTYANQYNSEDPSHWITATFPVDFTGYAEVEIVATGEPGSLCAAGTDGTDYWYGQVALNWAKITE